MCNATVMQFVCYFGEIKFIVDDKFFDSFNFMGQIEFFDGDSLYLRK